MVSLSRPTISDLHDEAMELSDRAFLAKRDGEDRLARQLLRKALRRESQAAETLPEQLSAEPTRSVLFRSAASMAMELHEYAVAVGLTASGLSGLPPPEIAAELRELRAEAERHLGTAR